MSFTCVAFGRPTPMITWSSNNSASIEPFGQSLTGSGNLMSTIVLTNLSLSDLDQWYTCMATNEFKMSASSSAFLSRAGLYIELISLK